VDAVNKDSYTEINAATWDYWAENGCEWSQPISHEDFLKAKTGDWAVWLAASKAVPKDWFPPLPGAKVLGLASGGGQQMPVFTALGAVCTVFDNSEKQLESERVVARREGYSISLIKGDMTKRLPFEDGSFDLIFHPTSNCYIEDVCHVWNECYRVLKKGGVLLAGFANELNFLFEGENPLLVVNKMPFNPLKMSEVEFARMAENYEAIQFSHSLEEQIGGQLKAGFILTDLFEDRDRPGGAAIRDFAPQYIATRAQKK
jgi:ubiquinone/menaquinone biosynthesis C-methylase UbiE